MYCYGLPASPPPWYDEGKALCFLYTVLPIPQQHFLLSEFLLLSLEQECVSISFKVGNVGLQMGLKQKVSVSSEAEA